jgi:hypothetical protein
MSDRERKSDRVAKPLRSGATLVSSSYPRKAEITRAVEAAKACGIAVASIEVSRDGSIKVLGPGLAPSPPSEFDKWDKAGRL